MSLICTNNEGEEMKTIAEMIEVMQAYADGAKIEAKEYVNWYDAPKPDWEWARKTYRIKSKQKTKLWYWEYNKEDKWLIWSRRQTEEQIQMKVGPLQYRKIKALGFTEEDE